MNILSVYPLPGISYTHDPNACLISDGGVLFAAEEERFLRGQHAIGHFPERAAIVGLRHVGLEGNAIDRFVTTSMERCRRRADYDLRLQFAREQLQVPASVPATCVPHHLAHSAGAVLTSPFDECAFLTLDGGGDGDMGHWGAWRQNRVRIIERIGLSPAAFFSFLTCLCGFPLFDEGKVMGLAAYGQIDVPLLAWFRDHFRIDRSTGSLRTALQMRWTPALDLTRVDLDAFARHKYARWRLDFVGHDDSRWIDEIPPVDIASTGQYFFQQLLAEIVDIVVARTGLKSIACSGGAFANVAMIGDLIRQRADVTVHVPLAPHDAGLALGAALWVRHTLGQARLTAPVSPYTGPSFSSDEVRRAIGEYGLSYAEPLDLCRTIASAIAAGKVVGWFDGRAEYGARALGARSVLADPRDRTARARLNQRLKRRDWFMPFAPSILEEYGEEYFEDFRPSPYMNVAFRVRKDKIADIPSAVHVDGTCRAHSVSRAMHPEYHALITAFHGMTGIPMVLNSSFNRHGLPMVSTPRQAVEHVLQGCVELLAIGGFVVEPRRSLDVTRLSDDNGCLALMMLRHAASMAQSGHFTAADRALSRVERGISACPDGLAYEGRTIWHCGSSLDELNRWWQAHHGAPD